MIFKHQNISDPVFWLNKTIKVIDCNDAFNEFKKSYDIFNSTFKSWLEVAFNNEGMSTLELDLVNTSGEKANYTVEGLCVTDNREEYLQVRIFPSIKTLTSRIKELEFLVEQITKERADSTKFTVEALHERNKAFTELESIQQQTQLIIDTVGEGILMVDPSGNISYANPTAVDILKPDVIGSHLRELFVKKEAYIFLEHRLVHGDSFHFGQIQFNTRTGIKFIELNFNPIEKGANKGGVLSFRDISKRIEAEELREKTLHSQLNALSAQMNPHFIFNALNSIQYFILNKGVEESLEYIANFSTLMRKTLTNSSNTFISVEEEIDYLKSYLELEKDRMDGGFEYHIENNIKEDILMPPMLIQPFVENSIVHGFNSLDSNGQLKVTFNYEGDYVSIIVEDNGIGREEAKKNDKKMLNHKSLGMELTKTKLSLLNKDNETYKVSITDGKDGGTSVKILFPANLES